MQGKVRARPCGLHEGNTLRGRINVNELATRTIQYRMDSGTVTDVVLTVFEPVRTNDDEWQCTFRFHPPENRRSITLRGPDCISALLACLVVARGYVEHPSEERTSWQGLSHSGLPWHNEIPHDYQPPQIPAFEKNEGNLDILATSRVGVPHGDDIRELILTVYRPICTERGSWKCAFAFGTATNEPVRYGLGVDFLESLLDALAMARVTYETMIPLKWEPPKSSELDCVRFWPYKVDRAYSIERAGSSAMGEQVDSG